MMTFSKLLILFIAVVVLCLAAEADNGRLSDLEFARKEYVEKSPAFTQEARAKALKLIAELRSQAATMTDAQFVFALGRISALADNAHDSFHQAEGAWVPALRLPVRMIWFPDALIIARAAPEQASLLGASVVAMEGLTPSQLMDRFRPVQGGTDVYRRWDLTWIFHSPEALNALGIAAAPDRIRMRLKLRDGTMTDRSLIAKPRESIPPGQHPSRYWIPSASPGESEKGWRTAVDPAKAPLYLQEGNAWFRMIALKDLDALYVQFRSNMDEDDEKIAPFVSRVMERLKSAPPQNIIVDLRFDTGGDNTQNRDLMKVISEKVPGHIYLLVGNYTFSAGIASAAALAHDGGKKVTIVGSEIGDRMYWWSEHGKPVCLPASKVCYAINTGYWDLVRGCKNNPKCFGDQFDLNVPSLEPTLPAPLVSRDWLENHDPAMEAVKTDLLKN